jgi:hypothetical protein
MGMSEGKNPPPAAERLAAPFSKGGGEGVAERGICKAQQSHNTESYSDRIYNFEGNRQEQEFFSNERLGRRQVRKALQIVLVEQKWRAAALRLGVEVFVDHHRVSKVVSRNVASQMTWTLESSQVFVKPGRGEYQVQIRFNVAV